MPVAAVSLLQIPVLSSTPAASVVDVAVVVDIGMVVVVADFCRPPPPLAGGSVVRSLVEAVKFYVLDRGRKDKKWWQCYSAKSITIIDEAERNGVRVGCWRQVWVGLYVSSWKPGASS